MSKDLNTKAIKQTLLEERESLLERIEERKAASHPDDVLNPDKTDLAMASQNNDRKTLLQDHSEQHLQDIETALNRLEAGTYGKCSNCGEPILPERLEIVPTANLCITCQRIEDQK